MEPSYIYRNFPQKTLDKDFGELLSFGRDQNLVDLVEKPREPLQGGVLSWILPGSHQETDKEKGIRRTIKCWSEKFDAHLEEFRFQPHKLRKLKRIAERSLRAAATLKGRLQEESCFSEATKKAMAKLNQMIQRVITAPEMDHPRRPITLISHTDRVWERSPLMESSLTARIMIPLLPDLSPKERGGLWVKTDPPEKNPIRRAKSNPQLLSGAQSRAQTSPFKPIDYHKLDKERRLVCSKIDQIRSVYEVCMFEPKWGKGWEERLIEGIQRVESKEVVIQIGRGLSTMQMMAVLNHLTTDQREQWKLIYLLGALKHEVFVEVIQTLGPNILPMVNGILRRSDPESIQWFEKEFNRHKTGFIRSCNQITGRIDSLAERFRSDDRGHLLKFADLAHLSELEDNIKLRLEGVSRYLRPLLEGVAIHPETYHVLFVGLMKEYRQQLMRLTETENEESRPAGCLLPIIFRNVFEFCELDDEEEAFEMFANWSIVSQDGYREVGLFGNISDEDFERLKQQKNVFQVARDNLSNLGITKVAHWKQKRVFNKGMLSEYLGERSRCRDLANWSLK